MISSTSDLICDIKHEEIKAQVAKDRVKASLLDKIDKKKDNVLHIMYTDLYYVRLSWTNKLKFLTQLLCRINCISSLSLLINTLYGVNGKMYGYTKIMTDEEFIYDMVLFDHNRTLDEKMLQECINQDLEWFKKLDDINQVAFFIRLLRKSAGILIAEVYKRMVQIYEKKLKQQMMSVSDENIENKSIENESMKKNSISMKYKDEDPNDPLVRKVNEVQNIWKEKIEKYRKSLNKSSDEKESTKSNKKNNKKKEKNKKNTNLEIDHIQLLPIQIVKKIFSYLDLKQLKKLRKVNSYWNYAIKDFLSDLKVQKILNTNNQKLKAKIKYLHENDDDDDDEVEPKPRIPANVKRVKKLYQRGAALKSLTETTDPLTHECLLSDATHIADEHYLFTFNQTKMFPRVVKKDDPPLYEAKKIIYKDLEVIEELSNELSSHSSLKSSFFTLSTDIDAPLPNLYDEKLQSQLTLDLEKIDELL